MIKKQLTRAHFDYESPTKITQGGNYAINKG